MVPAALTTGSINDYHPTTADFVLKDVDVVLVSSSGVITLTGLFSTGMADGQKVTLTNAGGFTWTLKHFDSGSVSSSRFILPGGGDFSLTSGQSITLASISGLWRKIG